MKTKRQAGFSMLEMLIVFLIITLLFGAVYLMMKTSADAYTNQSVHVALDGLGRDLTDRIARDLMDAGISTLDADPDGSEFTDSPFITFQRNEGQDFLNGKVVIAFGPAITYSWQMDARETDNGIDDDGDGLIDEGNLVRTEDGDAVILLRNSVRENGLTFTRLAATDTVSIQLQLHRRDENGTLVQRTATTTVRLRN